jgi:hypothetical protein
MVIAAPSAGAQGAGADRLRVRGGAGGTTALLDDLDRVAGHLRTVAAAMTGVAGRATAVAADPLLAVSALRSPVTFARVEERLGQAVAGPRGVVPVAGRLAALGGSVAAAVRAYRRADGAADGALQALEAMAGVTIGALVGRPAVLGLGLASWMASRIDVDGPATSPTMPALRRLFAEASAHPLLTEHAVGAAPGFLLGMTGLVPGPAAAALAGVVPSSAAPSSQAAPLTLPGSARVLGGTGAGGLLEDGAASVTAAPPSVVPAPRGVRDLVGGVADLDPDRGAAYGSVRVLAVRGPDGRRAWVVQIPGTQDWSPHAGSDPFDLTGCVHGIAGERTAARQAVIGAMAAAKVPPDEPVLLVGHSLGGIVAVGLACDPQFRAGHHVTHVITAGAPVGAFDPPDSVAVLSLEHDDDVVPAADGAANPDRPGWVTVSRRATGAGQPADPALAHHLESYAATGADVDASSDPSVIRWRAGLAPFLGGEGSTAGATVVVAHRVPTSTRP